MAIIPPEICSVLLFPGEFIPYAEVIAVLAVLGAVARVLLQFLVRMLPLEASLAPVIGAGLAGFEIHKHKVAAFLVLYIIVSAAIVAGKLPICAA